MDSEIFTLLMQRLDRIESNLERLESTALHETSANDKIQPLKERIEKLEDSLTWAWRSVILTFGALVASNLWQLLLNAHR